VCKVEVTAAKTAPQTPLRGSASANESAVRLRLAVRQQSAIRGAEGSPAKSSK
jgi:hypothetical protein